jgi:hypothetical protein
MVGCGVVLQVSPVARIPDMIPPQVPQILINREPLPHLRFNAELLGNCDEILEELSVRLGWTISSATTLKVDTAASEASVAPKPLPVQGQSVETVAAPGTTNTTVIIDEGPGDMLAAVAHAEVPPAQVVGSGIDEGEQDATELASPDPRKGYLHGHHFLEPNSFAFPGAVLAYVPSDDEEDAEGHGDDLSGAGVNEGRFVEAEDEAEGDVASPATGEVVPTEPPAHTKSAVQDLSTSS